jgi:hypothetical protein
MRYIYLLFAILVVLFSIRTVGAQSVTGQSTNVTIDPSISISPSVTPEEHLSPSPTIIIKEPSIFEQQEKREAKEEVVDEIKLEQLQEERAVLFNGRIVDEPNLLTFMSYTVQYAVQKGLPADTITLVLLLPLLATLVTFIRLVLGLPTLGMLVPIAFSITLLATGITTGVILLISIIFASTLARLMLKRVKIMQLPKVALSMFFVSLFIFITLMVSAMSGMFAVKQLSIFPVLMLILLSERIVDLQLQRSNYETVSITTTTIIIAIGGYFLLSSNLLRTIILVYPELILLLIPANLIIGRYFGLRLTEYYRFKPIRDGSK